MTQAAQKFAHLRIGDISLGPNVRVDLRDIESLTTSIRERGLLQPLTVIPKSDGTGAELLIGFRRYEACKRAGLDPVPCILRSRDPRDSSRLLDQLTENLVRDDMTVLEKARALQSLRDDGLSHQAIADRFGKSDQWVKNYCRVLTMPECLQEALHRGWVTLTKVIDIPGALLSNEAEMKWLADSFRHNESEGLSRWWQGHYARVRAREEAAERAEPDRPAPPGFERDPGPAFHRLRAVDEREVRRKAFSDAAHCLIEKHRAEFDVIYDALIIARLP